MSGGDDHDMSAGPVISDLLAQWLEAIDAADGEVDLATNAATVPQLLETFRPASIRSFGTTGELARHYGSIFLRFYVLLEEVDEPQDARFWLGRKIIGFKREAVHADTYLPPDVQAQGVARDLLGRAVQLYESLGIIDQIVTTSERIGRYANACAGYDFYDQTHRDAVVNAAGRVLRKLRRPDDLSTVQHPWEIVDAPGETTRAELAERGVHMHPEATLTDPVPLGKALLLADECPNWDGRISLDPTSESYRRMRQYTSVTAGPRTN